eukprot:4292629-Heterocapsa_arctica.AAC.1
MNLKYVLGLGPASGGGDAAEQCDRIRREHRDQQPEVPLGRVSAEPAYERPRRHAGAARPEAQHLGA